MSKWNMIIDVERCNNCYNCFIATKDEYVDNEFEGYTAPQPLHGHQWVDMKRAEGGQFPMVEAQFRPEMCNHCDDAPCMKVAENGAITKRDDGIVIIDPVKSKGQKQIVDACPYNAVFWNEELEIPQAWPFDAHLLDNGWEKTKIETVCPTDVFRSVKVSDQEMQRIAKEEGLKTLEPKEGAKPRVYYKNDLVFTSVFVGGSVATQKEGIEECVEGATVRLSQDGKELGHAITDAYGDFKITKLSKGLSKVKLQIDFKDLSQTIEADVDDSLYLGCINI
ncbi:MAG: hypothetical protein KTR16_13170 [Acidiferrobacterales bacterium]|nr:hypothetical protein [Acidiferrobacterales bacterium]